MFSWLRKLVKGPARLDDPVFGLLTYRGDYWEGAGVFPPTGTNVEYFITADENGPSAENYSTFQEICSRFAQLENKARLAISRTASQLGHFKTADTETLIVSSMDIPSGDFDSAIWEINFSNPEEAFFSVAFKGFETTGVVEISR